MEDKFDVDELLNDIALEIGTESDEKEQAPAEEEQTQTEKAEKTPAPQKSGKSGGQKKKKSGKKKKKKKKSPVKKFFSFLGKTLLIIVETALLLVLALYGVMHVIIDGPSPTARNLLVMSLRETSAMYWLPDLFLSKEEIALIESGGDEVEEYVETDTSLIVIQKPEDKVPQEGEDGQNQGPQADAWGLVDEDGDGIIVEAVHGEGYSGYMMVVLDPSRVIMGSVPESYGGRGYTVAQMVEKFDAVAGINAGGFEDPDGKGNGSIPNTMCVYKGEVYYANKGVQDGFVGFDDNYIMHVGKLTAKDVKAKNIQYGVSFGPVLISNGEPANLNSGVNPRTAIGQRSDGAVLLLVIDGRQVISLGATYNDLIEIFQEYGAVNACNLDGGSSTLMWFGGDYINNCASVVGIRPVPTTFLVMKEGVTNNG